MTADNTMSCASPLPECDAVRLSRDGKQRVVALASGQVILAPDKDTPSYPAREILCRWPQDITTGPERLVLRVAAYLWQEHYRVVHELLCAALGGEAKSWDHARVTVRAVVGDHRWARLPDDLRAELDAGSGAGRASLYAAAHAALVRYADSGETADGEIARQALLACADDDAGAPAQTLRWLVQDIGNVNRDAFASRVAHLADLEAKALAAREPPLDDRVHLFQDMGQFARFFCGPLRDRRSDVKRTANPSDTTCQECMDALLRPGLTATDRTAADLDDHRGLAWEVALCFNWVPVERPYESWWRSDFLRTLPIEAMSRLRDKRPDLAARVKAYRGFFALSSGATDAEPRPSGIFERDRLNRAIAAERGIAETWKGRCEDKSREVDDLRSLLADKARENEQLRGENRALRNRIRELEERRLTDEASWDWLRATAGAEGGQALVDRVEELRAAEQALATTRATLADVEAHRDELDADFQRIRGQSDRRRRELARANKTILGLYEDLRRYKIATGAASK